MYNRHRGRKLIKCGIIFYLRYLSNQYAGDSLLIFFFKKLFKDN